MPFYIWAVNIAKESVTAYAGGFSNSYDTLSHEFGHAFDLTNLNYQYVVECEAIKLFGKNFTIQTYWCFIFGNARLAH